MAARLHEDGCAAAHFVQGYGRRDCSCVPGRFEERSTVSRPGPGVILSIFRTSDGRILFAVESTHPTSAGRVAICTAEQLG